MGKRGPAAEPTALKIIKGQPYNRDEPQPPEQRPSLPEWATGDDEGAQRWREVWAFSLGQWPWVMASDESLFNQYVTAVVDAERLGRALLRSPMLERDPATGGPKKLTVRTEWQNALNVALRLGQQFGGTSSSRSALKATLLQPEGLGREAGADALFG